MKQISSYQAAGLMLCFSLPRLAAFRPGGDNLLVCAAAELLAGAAALLVCIAPAKLPALKSKAAGRLFAALAAGGSALLLALLLAGFASSIQYLFPNFYASWAIIAALAASAAYCASMGLAGCARSACAAVFLTVPVLVLMIVGTAKGFDVHLLELAVPDRSVQFFRQFSKALAAQAGLPAVSVLLRGRIDRPVRAMTVWLSAKAVIFTVMFAVCKGVLGSHSADGLPLFSLAAYAKTSVIERFDALLLLFGTLCTLFSAAALLIGITRSANVFSQRAGRYAYLTAAAVSAAGACFLADSGLAASAALTGAAAAGILVFSTFSGREEA